MTTQQSKLLSQFEIVNGCTSNEFDSKDWIKFDRFCEHQKAEEEKELILDYWNDYKQFDNGLTIFL